MYLYDRTTVHSYLSNKKNAKHIGLAIIAVVVGTILADVCMWYAVKQSSRKNLPIAIALVHTAPIFSLILVALFFKEYLNWKAMVGVIMIVVGVILCIFYSGESIHSLT